MMFFALLACLVSLRSILALVVATALIALHHLSLSFIMPSLIYPSGDFFENLGRTVFHAVIVVMETAALVATVHRLNRLDRDMLRQTETLKDSLEDADRARNEAQTAQDLAEDAQKSAIAAKTDVEAALQKAQEAERVRQASEAEKASIDAERRNREAAHREEQEHVVGAIRVALTKLATGDLTTRITTPFPAAYATLSEEFNAALETLETAVSEVAKRSDQMDLEIEEISRATEDLARRTDQQAQSLTQTAESLDSLTQSVVQSNESVEEVNNFTQTAQSTAKNSGDVVSKASLAMEAIQTEATEIAKIVELIEGISFQTNLLALNAGVEAARAGDVGRGFAVVASEVRGLAQRSSESATSIRALIERSANQVENGSDRITETVQSLQTVETTISDISNKMESISESSKVLSDRILVLNGTIAEMDGVTQRNAIKFEETSAACSNLALGAKTLRDLTQRFTISDNGPKEHRIAS
ncbi:MAG: methyl-accepting chemotaxis protein [Paracoccaceae bacterium]